MFKSDKGFAKMPLEQRTEVARRGGLNAHAKGVAHEYTREEAIEAGRKGGQAIAARGREYMREIGRKGGLAKGESARQRREWEAQKAKDGGSR